MLYIFRLPSRQPFRNCRNLTWLTLKKDYGKYIYKRVMFRSI